MTNAQQAEFERAVSEDCGVKLDCACGFTTMYETFDAFNEARRDGDLNVRWEGDWDWAFAHEQVTVACPDCGAEGSDTELRGRASAATIALSLGTDISTRKLEADALVGATAPLHKRRVAFTEAIDADVPVRLDCECGHQTQFASIGTVEAAADAGDTQFEYDGHHPAYALADGEFTVGCPDCGANAAVATLHDEDGERVLVLTIAVGDTCPACDVPVQDAGFKEGPDAPEIGWEYYECPDCEARMRIERVGATGD